MHTLNIELSPEQYAIDELRRQAVARQMGCSEETIARIVVRRRSLDARRRQVCYHCHLEVYLQGEPTATDDVASPYRDCRNSPEVVIVGAGPAGLFAALHCLELGLRPVIVDRGRAVEQRKGDIALLGRDRKVNPDSNWCFGEGGAGTYSDGKLYTRSTKRGNVSDVLKKFVEHGADPDIMIDAHAHIGTDRLSGIIANIRKTVEGYGGEYHFGKRVTDLIVEGGRVTGVTTQDGDRLRGIAVLLATGHSARDIYELFAQRGWLLQAKPFAMGVRVEHPQRLIDTIQYHSAHPSRYLPPAAYSLTTQVEGHGVFSFCMCPGGVIVPASTDDGQQVVNGMSNAHRSSPYANSGIAVTVGLEDVPEYAQHGSLALLRFQQEVERQMFEAAGRTISAPTQRLTDFCDGKSSTTLNKTNYIGPTVGSPLHELLPSFIVQCLQKGFRVFDQKMRGFYTDQASLLAVESRTSSPVRIPRGDDYQHLQLQGLYPCGEGAGYAGGIVSSAIDGINCIDAIFNHYHPSAL